MEAHAGKQSALAAMRAGLASSLAYYVELVKIARQLLLLAGRDSLILVVSVALSFAKVGVAMRAARIWPWLTAVMDHDGDVGGVIMEMFGYSAALALMTFAVNRLKDSFFSRLLEHIQIAAARAFYGMDTAFWDSCDPSQQVVWIFQQADRVKSFLGHIESLLYCLFTLGGGVVHIYLVSPKIALASVSVMGLASLYFFYLNKLLALATGSMDVMLSDLKSGAIESLMNIRTVQAFAGEQLEMARYVGRKTKWWECRNFFVAVEAVRRGSELLLREARALGTNYASFWFVSTGAMQVGEGLVLQALLAEFLVGTYDSLVGTMRVISIDLYFSQVFLNMLKTPVQIPVDVGEVPAKKAEGCLEFRDVDFCYPTRPEEKVLKGVTFRVPAGSFAALVGTSGSGKTTVGRLLERFYDVQGGAVLLDGKDVRKLQPRWLREQVGYVEQEPKLFRGTIRENIRYGKPSASDAAVEAAAREAHVLDFAQNLPSGLDADVGGGGGQGLSGGQKQRVAIARAMLRNPSVVLLDEATSALDTETEALLQEALERLVEGRTRLVIAHRLSTVFRADQILVMRLGRIVEAGTHAELAAKEGGAYAQLMRHQALHAAASAGASSAAATSSSAPAVPAATAAAGEDGDKAAMHAAADAAACGQLPEQEPLLRPPEAVPPVKLPLSAQAPAPHPVEAAWLGGIPHEDSGTVAFLLWMYRMMGKRKWILLACVAFSLLESWAKTKIGPAFGRASALMDTPSEYMPAFWAYVATNISACMLRFIKERLKDFFEPHLAETIQGQVVYKLMRQDVDYFTAGDKQNDPANIVPRLFDQTDMAVLMTTVTSENFIHGVVTLALLIYEMYVLSPNIVLWTLAFSLPIVALFCLVFGVEGHRMQVADRADKELYAVAIESLNNIRTVHAFGGEAAELAKFSACKRDWWRAEMSRRRITWISDGGGLAFSAVSTFAMMLVIVRNHSGRKSSVVAALLFMIKSFYDELSIFSLTVGAIGHGRGSMRTLAQALREPSAIPADVGEIPGWRAEGAVEFRDVSFSYGGPAWRQQAEGPEVLSHVSFAVKPGSFTAIVGPSGSGKTTLGRLLLRFHDVSAGEVLLDGRPVSGLNPQWLRKQIGYVEQEPKLFQETLWNNIRYGRVDASGEEILGAAAAANVLPFLQSLPKGLDTDVGRFGQDLSGGQKQRVALARALLINPAMLLLDEATSALDSETERAVQQALEHVMAGRTTIAIAHRLSTVARADQVIVMEAGRVVQQGTHSELAAIASGTYSRLLPSLISGPEDAAVAAPAAAPAPTTEGDEGLRKRH